MLWEDFGGESKIMKSKCNYLACLGGQKDIPKKLAVRVHQLLFSKSVFLKIKMWGNAIMGVHKTIQRPKEKRGEFDLTCLADP